MPRVLKDAYLIGGMRMSAVTRSIVDTNVLRHKLQEQGEEPEPPPPPPPPPPEGPDVIITKDYPPAPPPDDQLKR